MPRNIPVRKTDVDGIWPASLGERGRGGMARPHALERILALRWRQCALWIAQRPGCVGRERSFIDGKHMQLVALVRAMRPHQWVKNLLLFVPLVTAHRITDIQAWTHAVQAFLAKCLTAAASYIANDLSDL